MENRDHLESWESCRRNWTRIKGNVFKSLPASLSVSGICEDGLRSITPNCNEFNNLARKAFYFFIRPNSSDPHKTNPQRFPPCLSASVVKALGSRYTRAHRCIIPRHKFLPQGACA
jgi:hypothetical protein